MFFRLKINGSKWDNLVSNAAIRSMQHSNIKYVHYIAAERLVSGFCGSSRSVKSNLFVLTISFSHFLNELWGKWWHVIVFSKTSMVFLQFKGSYLYNSRKASWGIGKRLIQYYGIPSYGIIKNDLVLGRSWNVENKTSDEQHHNRLHRVIIYLTKKRLEQPRVTT